MLRVGAEQSLDLKNRIHRGNYRLSYEEILNYEKGPVARIRFTMVEEACRGDIGMREGLGPYVGVYRVLEMESSPRTVLSSLMRSV